MPTRIFFLTEYQENEEAGLCIQQSITRLLQLRLVSACALISAGYNLTNESGYKRFKSNLCLILSSFLSRMREKYNLSFDMHTGLNVTGL